MKKLGYVKLTARPPHHAQNEHAVDAFKKGGFAAGLAKVKAILPKGTPIEVRFQDEAGVGQKNIITRRWARRGTRPSAPKDQRTKSAYIFGAICPELGKGAGLVLPFCNTDTMSLHLAEISLAVAPGLHAVVVMDQAGRHMAGKLYVLYNIRIVALAAKCPELNPVENIWQFMRDNWLSNRVFTSCETLWISAVKLGTSSSTSLGAS
ncbi:IS630 family transposase [Sphingobium estronivorans]|uniref:IS630 family transposase n=1 Tax=Sphingobium estronivorans TaxID=1577690 RepID=UPI0013C2ACF7|nr:IS630 family transposase [Sphingobium estronivorans]